MKPQNVATWAHHYQSDDNQSFFFSLSVLWICYLNWFTDVFKCSVSLSRNRENDLHASCSCRLYFAWHIRFLCNRFVRRVNINLMMHTLFFRLTSFSIYFWTFISCTFSEKKMQFEEEKKCQNSRIQFSIWHTAKIYLQLLRVK